MENNYKIPFKLEDKLNISDSSIDQEMNDPKKFSNIGKVLRILTQVKSHLDLTLAGKELTKDLYWVIKKIETNSLYSNIYDEITNDEEKQDDEKKEFLEGFQEYSFVNEIKKNSRERMVCRTAHHYDFNGFKSIRNMLESHKTNFKVDKKDFIVEKMENIDEDENDLNVLSLNSKKTRELKKINTIKSTKSNANGAKLENLSNELPSEVNEELLKFETIKDEKIINFKIDELDSTSFNNTNFNMNAIVSRKFNIFNFESIFTREKVFQLVGTEIFRNLDLNNMIDTSKLNNFLIQLRNNYIPSNPYHNERHGVDVGLNVATYLKESEIIDTCLFHDLDILSMIVAALGHDVGHNGKNNSFHINSKSQYALFYHDKSVLENYHIYLIFKILRDEENNILINLKKEEYTIFRKRVIEGILATDMSIHGNVLSKIKNKLFNWSELKKTNEEEPFINPESKTLFDEQQEVINFVIHSADIAHNTKPFIMSEKWTELLTEEFHLQGDLEKSLGLPISFLCDRNTSNVPKSQIGFIDFVILPTFQLLKEAFPSCEYLVKIAQTNKETWKKILDEKEKLEKEQANN